jgi:DNA-binding MarR family transcriptional regulator
VTGRQSRLPLFALLSHALVAFTIEFDNELERRLPHRTTDHGRSGGGDSRHAPWLVSLAMWETCMRYVGEEGITVRELQRLARTGSNLAGMRRWGYILLDPDPSRGRSKQPVASAVIRATEAGRRAQAVWEPLLDEIEGRWRERFGPGEVAELHGALASVAAQLDPGLPDCLPILGYGLSGGRPVEAGASKSWKEANDSADKSWNGGNDSAEESFARRTIAASDQLPPSRLLARVLLAFAIEFEESSEVSLAICADAMRLLDDDGVRVSELPRRAGVSKEAMTMAVGYLTRHGYAESVADPSRGRGKVVRLTDSGRDVQAAYARLVLVIEEGWGARFGSATVARLRESLERVTGDRARLFSGLEPPPGGWRAAVRPPDVLPDYPMVLHRGGFPDGS